MRAWSKYTGCLMLVLGLASTTLAQRPEPNAFLNKPVRTAEGLRRQVTNDPEVTDRYMRHYAMTRAEVLDLMAGLHMARLAKNTPMTVFNVNDRGVIGSRLFVIKAGSMLFVDQDGTPVLKVSCGNPFFRDTEILHAQSEVEVEAVTHPLKYDDEEGFVAMPVAELLEPSFAVAEALPEEQPIHLPLGGTEDVFTRPGSDPALWPLLLLGGLRGSPRNPPKEDSPVPGPAAAIMFAGPMAAAALRRRKARKEHS